MHALLAVHDQVGQAPHLVAVGGGHADHLRDDVHRQLAGEVADEVEGALLERRLEKGQGQVPDVRFEVGHPPGREPLGDEGPHAVVAGRVEGVERHVLVGVGPGGGGVEGDAVRGREAGGVAEGGHHVGVARQGPEVELVVAVEGGLVAQAGVGRVGVLVDLVGVGAVGQLVRGQRAHARLV